MRLAPLIVAALLATSSTALAQSWAVRSFDAAGFAVQTPRPLTQSAVRFRFPDGREAPASAWTLDEADLRYRVTVVDLTGIDLDARAAILAAAEGLKRGRVLDVETEARIDREFGRSLSLAAPDGSRIMASVFAVRGKLYVLEAEAKTGASAKAIRFQQSLELTGLAAEAFRPENRPGGRGPGPSGRPAGRRGPPPPQAFADCKGRSEGERVRHATPRGEVAAVCVATPQGLAARPEIPPG